MQERLEQAIQSLGLANHVTLESRFLPEADCAALISLAEVVVFPYQNTEESASAAVRMALATGSAIATTPLPIFQDLTGVTYSLSGTTAADIAQGIASVLHTYISDAQALTRARQLAQQRAYQQGAQQLAPRLTHLLYGLHAQQKSSVHVVTGQQRDIVQFAV